MSVHVEEKLKQFELNAELELYNEYQRVMPEFKYVVETARRLYLANTVDMQSKGTGANIYFEVALKDAWVWDIYRKDRRIKQAHICSFKDVNIEELA
ncbi:MAG: DUF2469 domain-containing protein [Candidatus Ancillula trichonymphae]|jgi:hypothetical protein|nr:DUF2469 domain-containing protein [Candidatus Ancillula trichonymphae]